MCPSANPWGENFELLTISARFRPPPVVLEDANHFLFRLVLQVDPTVFHMLNEDPGGISFSEIGGLSEQIRELREVIELPLTNPELFIRVGIKPPKVETQLASAEFCGLPIAVCGALLSPLQYSTLYQVGELFAKFMVD